MAALCPLCPPPAVLKPQVELHKWPSLFTGSFWSLSYFAIFKKKKTKIHPRQQQNAKAFMCFKCLKCRILPASQSTSASWWGLKRIGGAERWAGGCQRRWGERVADAGAQGDAQRPALPLPDSVSLLLVPLPG